jgi:hypothetical protein
MFVIWSLFDICDLFARPNNKFRFPSSAGHSGEFAFGFFVLD